MERRPTRPVAASTLFAIVAVTALFVVAGGAADRGLAFAANPPSGGSAASQPASGAAGLALLVDPSSWWMRDGNSTVLAAVWTGLPPGCENIPLWYRWSDSPGPGAGTLASSDQNSTVFTAASLDPGTSEVRVEAATVVRCGADETVVDATAGSNVTVVAPLALDRLTVTPDPVPAGAVANLSGVLVGGAPPYRLEVAWGDGAVSFANVSATGAFSLGHGFPAGDFGPTVVATDASGQRANASTDEPLYSSGGLAVGIRPSTTVAEVGVPVGFAGVVIDPPTAYGSASLCTGPGGGVARRPPADATAENFSCTFANPGTAEVEFEVVPVSSQVPPASAELSEPVEPRLGLEVVTPPASAEAGRVAGVSATVTGGVPPFAISWQLSGTANLSSTTLATDGTVELPILAGRPGSYVATVTVVDGVGEVAANSSSTLEVAPRLFASAAVGRPVTPNGTAVEVAGTVTAGDGPYLWAVVPSLVPAYESPQNGSLDTAAGFDWNGTFSEEGNVSVTVAVVDQDGAGWWDALPTPLVSPLRVDGGLNASRDGNSTLLRLGLTIEGGLPPFVVEANATRGGEGNLSAPSDGSFSYSWVVNGTGAFDLTVAVLDRLGARATVNLSASTPASTPPPSSPPPSAPPPGSAPPLPSTAAPVLDVTVGTTLAVALALGAAGVWTRWRRRDRSPQGPAPEPDAVAVLRGIIEPADGVDRSTVELLAEEEGVPLARARSTLDRLVAEGTVRSETGADGEEVLAWSTRA